MEDELTRFAREMAELEGGGAVDAQAPAPVASAPPRVVSKTISAAPVRAEPPQPSAAAAAVPPAQPHHPAAAYAAYAPAQSYGASAARQTPASLPPPAHATSGSTAQAAADRRNEELKKATEAVSAQARFDHARELASTAHAHMAAVAAAGAQAGAAGAAGSQPPVKRTMAGVEWEDPTMADWPENDFRLFVGNLGNDATDLLLTQAFSKYPSFQRARAVRDKRYNKPAGYGFVSFKEPWDMTAAMREMNNKYIGSRPVKLKKSNWKERSLEEGKAPEWEYHKVKKVEPNEHKKKKPRTVKWP